MRQVCFINGSPKNKNSCSGYLIGVMKDILDTQTSQSEEFHIASCLKADTKSDAFYSMAQSDCIVFVFPLYIDSIPSHMLDFLYEFEEFYRGTWSETKKTVPNVYAVINNGFIEGHQNRNAARIIQHFTHASGLRWRFAIGIGAGEFIKDSQHSVPLQSRLKKNIYSALLYLKADIENTESTCENNIFTSVNFYKPWFIFFANQFWIKAARKNNVRKSKLYFRPWETAVESIQDNVIADTIQIKQNV